MLLKLNHDFFLENMLHRISNMTSSRITQKMFWIHFDGEFQYKPLQHDDVLVNFVYVFGSIDITL